MNEDNSMSETPENKYGTTPYSAMKLPDLGDEPRASKMTKMLVWPLMALHLISTVLLEIQMLQVDPETYYGQMLPPEQAEQLTPEALDTLATWSTVTNVATATITLVLFVIVGLGLRANRTWARFLGLVLAFLFLLISGYSLLLATDYGNLATIELFIAVLGWVTVLLTIWWIVQAMSRETTQWFAIHTRLQS